VQDPVEPLLLLEHRLQLRHLHHASITIHQQQR
jgi:hypothetical protein